MNSIDSSSTTTNNKLEDSTLILFARTDREKEEWFKLFKKSAAKTLLDSGHFTKLNEKRLTISKKNSAEIITNNISLKSLKENKSCHFSYNASSDKIVYKLDDQVAKKDSMSDQDSSVPSLPSSPSSPGWESIELIEKSAENETQTESGLIYDSSLAFMNTFLIRLFADFFEHQYWISKIQQKMQNKLNTIKLPYFMEGLNIINLDLGKRENVKNFFKLKFLCQFFFLTQI